MSEVKTITQFYKAILKQDEDAQKLFELQNQYHHLFQFDPITFENLPSTLDAVIDKNIEYHKNISKKQPIHDYLYRIFLFAEPAFKHIFSVLKNKILREHTMLPISKVREIDAKSISWLNKKPGRTVKQKIGGAGKIFAPHRIISIDTAENRLLKATASKLSKLLSAQQKATGIYSVKTKFIKRWLQSEDAECIGDWNNIPPNNVLLSDKNYKKIWKAWIELQRIDSRIKEYIEHIDEIKQTMYNVDILTSRYQKEESHIIQRPVLGDKNFNLTMPFKDHRYIAKDSILKHKKVNLENYADNLKKNYILKEVQPIKTPFCTIDLTSIKPNFSFCKDEIRQLPFILLQQIWKYSEKKSNKTITQFVDCGNAQAIILNSEDKNVKIDTFSFHDSLNQDVNKYSFNVNEITSILIKKLSSYLMCSKLIYFLPESLDDFSSQIIRTNINLYFFNAEQLPRSISKIMLHFNGCDENTIDTEKYYVVKEETDSEIIYTPIKAIKDKSSSLELKKLIKNHNGIIWERHPSIIERKKYQNKVQDENQFIDTIPLSDREFLPKIKKNSNDIEFYNMVLNTDKHEKKSDNISKALEKYPHEIIELDKNDVIRGGMLFAQNKQILENEKKDIPLWKDHLPPLKLKTFETEIQLVKDNTSIIPKRGHAVIIDVEQKFTLSKNSPFIEFELERSTGQQHDKFFAYIKNKYFPLQEDIDCNLHLTYTYGDNKPYKLSFIPRNNIQKQQYEAFIVEWTPQTHIDINGLSIPNYPPIYEWKDFFDYPEADKPEHSDIISWWIGQFDLIEKLKTNPSRNIPNFKKSLRFPTFIICNNAMSIIDNMEIKEDFKLKFKQARENAEFIIQNFDDSDLKEEMRLFLSVLHKDMPESNIQFLMESCKYNFNEYYRRIAFALGDLSQEWQENLFNFTLKNYLTEDSEEIDYVLRLLSIAIWRHKEFIFRLNNEQLIIILKIITLRLVKNKKIIEKDSVSERIKHDKGLNFSFFIELLIGLLRLREKEEYREALFPYSSHIKELYTVLKSLKNFDIKTRMKFKSDDKSEIQALEYLMERLIGNIKNSSIKITGVSAG